MRVCVFGAGAVGGHLAARLAKGGAEVAVIARGPQLAAIAARGITVHASDGEIHARVRAAPDTAAIGKQDAVLVTVKAPALPAVAAAIGPLLGPETPVVFVINGIPWWYFHAHPGPHDGRRLPHIDPDDALWRAVGPARAIGGVVYSACTVIEPGVIHVENRQSRLILGEPNGQISARAQAIAEPLAAAGIAAEVTGRIRDAVWSKLLLNLTSSPFSVITGAPPRAVFTDSVCAEAARRIVAEGVAIAAAMGCRPIYDTEAQIAMYQAMAHKPSMLQDLERGRVLEFAAQLAAPLELARLAGVATPTLDLIVTLARLRAEAAGLLG